MSTFVRVWTVKVLSNCFIKRGNFALRTASTACFYPTNYILISTSRHPCIAKQSQIWGHPLSHIIPPPQITGNLACYDELIVYSFIHILPWSVYSGPATANWNKYGIFGGSHIIRSLHQSEKNLALESISKSMVCSFMPNITWIGASFHPRDKCAVIYSILRAYDVGTNCSGNFLLQHKQTDK